MISLRNVATACLLVGLTGCGVTYHSSSVKGREDGSKVHVVDLTPATIAQANSNPYTPRALPAEFFAAAGGGTGVAGVGALPAQPFLPTERPETLEERPLPDVTAPDYVIGVGDVLLLATSGNTGTVEQLTGLLAAQSKRQGYTVRDDGTIAIPQIGSVPVEGLTLQSAEETLFQALVTNQLDPTFSLEVAEFNSQRISVGGAVRDPKLVPVTPSKITLGEALTAAGGLSVKDEDFATIRIFRADTLYQMPLSKFRKNQSWQNKVLLNGDAIFVDTTYDLDRALSYYKSQLDVIALRSDSRSKALQSVQVEMAMRRAALSERRENFLSREKLGAVKRDYVYLTGEVKSQGRVALPFDHMASLADVLYGEKGFDNTTGNPKQIYVIRANEGAYSANAYHLNASNAADLIMTTRFEMRPNDIVFIEEQPITKWNRALQQIFPSLITATGNAVRK
ncbi:MAG: polysaccharide biosynthesis/export family protein [Pelagimonas sp.]|nr:polysaccharide biosynthesis/export family protein [Pelagimonas sp.]